MKRDYAAERLDPRWQKMRLKVMERDGFACCMCFNESETLNVHHLAYGQHRAVWDYPADVLVTLCKSCHEDWHDLERAFAEVEKTPHALHIQALQLICHGIRPKDPEGIQAALTRLLDLDATVEPAGPSVVELMLAVAEATNRPGGVAWYVEFSTKALQSASATRKPLDFDEDF